MGGNNNSDDSWIEGVRDERAERIFWCKGGEATGGRLV
jgi:hypothetical protein